MKTLFTLLITLMASSFTLAMDVYADGYRFGPQTNATQKVGFSNHKYNVTYDFTNSGFAIGTRHYISFTNLEFGLLNEVSYKVDSNAVDYRVANITGDFWFQYTPYLKIGDKLFATLMYDTTNSWVSRVGYNFF